MGLESNGNCDNGVIADYVTTHGQRFLTESLERDFIRILSENLNTLEVVKDPLSRKILLSIRESGKLNFNISNHESFFCRTIKKPEQLLQYLTFRYKFRLASAQRRVFDAPPYLLLEPVSTCNLRCPMCFQIDKTFTRKKWEDNFAYSNV